MYRFDNTMDPITISIIVSASAIIGAAIIAGSSRIVVEIMRERKRRKKKNIRWLRDPKTFEITQK